MAGRRPRPDASDKLRNLAYPEAALRISARRATDAHRRFPSPEAGTVIEKMAIEGARFSAGEPLYRIVELPTCG